MCVFFWLLLRGVSIKAKQTQKLTSYNREMRSSSFSEWFVLNELVDRQPSSLLLIQIFIYFCFKWLTNNEMIHNGWITRTMKPSLWMQNVTIALIYPPCLFYFVTSLINIRNFFFFILFIFAKVFFSFFLWCVFYSLFGITVVVIQRGVFITILKAFSVFRFYFTNYIFVCTFI